MSNCNLEQLSKAPIFLHIQEGFNHLNKIIRKINTLIQDMFSEMTLFFSKGTYLDMNVLHVLDADFEKVGDITCLFRSRGLTPQGAGVPQRPQERELNIDPLKKILLSVIPKSAVLIYQKQLRVEIKNLLKKSTYALLKDHSEEVSQLLTRDQETVNDFLKHEKLLTATMNYLLHSSENVDGAINKTAEKFPGHSSETLRQLCLPKFKLKFIEEDLGLQYIPFIQALAAELIPRKIVSKEFEKRFLKAMDENIDPLIDWPIKNQGRTMLPLIGEIAYLATEVFSDRLITILKKMAFPKLIDTCVQKANSHVEAIVKARNDSIHFSRKKSATENRTLSPKENVIIYEDEFKLQKEIHLLTKKILESGDDVDVSSELSEYFENVITRIYKQMITRETITEFIHALVDHKDQLITKLKDNAPLSIVLNKLLGNKESAVNILYPIISELEPYIISSISKEVSVLFFENLCRPEALVKILLTGLVPGLLGIAKEKFMQDIIESNFNIENKEKKLVNFSFKTAYFNLMKAKKEGDETGPLRALIIEKMSQGYQQETRTKENVQKQATSASLEIENSLDLYIGTALFDEDHVIKGVERFMRSKRILDPLNAYGELVYKVLFEVNDAKIDQYIASQIGNDEIKKYFTELLMRKFYFIRMSDNPYKEFLKLVISSLESPQEFVTSKEVWNREMIDKSLTASSQELGSLFDSMIQFLLGRKVRGAGVAYAALLSGTIDYRTKLIFERLFLNSLVNTNIGFKLIDTFVDSFVEGANRRS
ncbi:hypothetical protein N9Y92_00170 [Chlamydiales bacterium]|nr:hypothetical protein [Chlamydiales bacterium]